MLVNRVKKSDVIICESRLNLSQVLCAPARAQLPPVISPYGSHVVTSYLRVESHSTSGVPFQSQLDCERLLLEHERPTSLSNHSACFLASVSVAGYSANVMDA